jgi:farnesol dehydrogenase
MKYLITGANGYIGTHLVRQLVHQGNEVHAFILPGTDDSLIQHPNIRIFEGDVLRPEDLQEALAGCEAVFHLASIVSPWEKDAGIFHRINVQGTQLIMQQCLEQGIRRVLISSSCGIFGPSRKGVPVDETTDNAANLREPYELSKYHQAEAAKRFLPKGLEVVVVYPTRVYGPGIASQGNTMTRIIKGAIEGTWHIIPGNGKGIGNYALVEDVARGMARVMEEGRNGEGYILGGDNTTYDDLFSMVQRFVPQKIRLFKAPYYLLYLAAMEEEFRAAWTGKAPFITRHGAKKFTGNWAVSTEKIRRELGFRQTPLEEGIRLTIESFGWSESTRHSTLPAHP